MLRVFRLRELHRTGNAEARVIDNDVDMVFPLQDLIDRCRERLLVRDICDDMVQALDPLRAAGQLIDGVALFQHGLRRTLADAGSAARNHTYLAHRSYLLRTSAIVLTASSISACVCVAIRLVRSRHSCGAAAGGSDELT